MKKCCVLLILFLLGCSTVRSTRTQTGQTTPSELPKGILPMQAFGGTALGSSELNHPQGITIDSQGNLYITDSGNDRVVKCDSLGDFIKEVGGFGRAEGQFNHPGYLASDQGSNIYVVDTQNKRVQKFDRELSYMSSIRLEATGETLGFGLIQGIAVARNGEMILSDTHWDCLLALDNLDQYKSNFAGFGYGEGTLSEPMGLDIDEKGNIYVADTERNRIAVYDVFGNYVKSVGEKVLRKPKGVAVGSEGIVYVANSGMNDLAIFDRQGNPVLKFGSWGKEVGKFSHPTDIKVRGDLMYVVDSDNNRIQILRSHR